MSDVRTRKAPEKKAVVVTDLAARTVAIHRPLLNEGAGPKWLPGESVLVADYGRLDGEIQTMLGLHGLKQKLADGYAGPDTDISEVSDIWDRLVEGDWDSGRSGTGLPRFFAEAYASVRGVALETVRPRINAILAGDDPDKLANLRQWAADPRVKAASEKIKAQKAAERAKAAAVAAKTAPAAELEDI